MRRQRSTEVTSFVAADSSTPASLSARTPRGISALAELSGSFGYSVTSIPVYGCLHLKSGCSALPDGRFLVNADWIDVSPLPSDQLLHVPADEPWAGDVLVIGERIILSEAFPETADLLERQGWDVIPVAVSEFEKVEGGVTCLSLVFEEHARV